MLSDVDDIHHQGSPSCFRLNWTVHFTREIPTFSPGRLHSFPISEVWTSSPMYSLDRRSFPGPQRADPSFYFLFFFSEFPLSWFRSGHRVKCILLDHVPRLWSTLLVIKKSPFFYYLKVSTHRLSTAIGSDPPIFLVSRFSLPLSVPISQDEAGRIRKRTGLSSTNQGRLATMLPLRFEPLDHAARAESNPSLTVLLKH